MEISDPKFLIFFLHPVRIRSNFRNALICEFINHEKWETWKWETLQTVDLIHFENVVGDELSYYKSIVIIIIITIIVSGSSSSGSCCSGSITIITNPLNPCTVSTTTSWCITSKNAWITRLLVNSPRNILIASSHWMGFFLSVKSSLHTKPRWSFPAYCWIF